MATWTLPGRLQLERYRNRGFLKAAMAAAALVADADGEVTLSERYRIDAILERLERLRLHDPHKAVEILDRFISSLHEDAESARPVLLGKVSRMAHDPEAAQMLVRIAKSVSDADGVVNDAEADRIAQIRTVLNLAPEDGAGLTSPTAGPISPGSQGRP